MLSIYQRLCVCIHTLPLIYCVAFFENKQETYKNVNKKYFQIVKILRDTYESNVLVNVRLPEREGETVKGDGVSPSTL